MTEHVTISKEVEFDAGHRVPSHASKCRNPHGHRYRVRVTCRGPIVNDPGAPDDGMLVDFGDLKALMTSLVHDPWDHAMLVHVEDDELADALAGHGWRVVMFPYVPTAENMARHIWEVLDGPIAERFRLGLMLERVDVWETPTSVATYRGGA